MKTHNFEQLYKQKYPEEEAYRYLLDYACLFRLKLISDFLGDIEGKAVVDIGCGGGAISFLLRVLGAEVHSVDVSNRALNVTRKVTSLNLNSERFKPVFCRNDLANLSFKAEVFDAVCCTEILQWKKDDKAAMQEIERVTKPGGIVVLSVPYDERLTHMGAGLGYYTERGMVVLPVSGDSGEEDKSEFPSYYRRYSLRTIGERLSSQQLVIEQVFFWRFPMVELLDRVRLRNFFAILGLLVNSLSNRYNYYAKRGIRDYETFFQSLLVFYRTRIWQRFGLRLFMRLLDLDGLFRSFPRANDVFLVLRKARQIRREE